MRDDAPKLDRLITRTVRTSGSYLADRTFRFGDLSTSFSTAGTWVVGETTLTMAEKDADGRLLPSVKDFEIAADSIFELVAIGYTVQFLALAYDYPRNSWNQEIDYARE